MSESRDYVTLDKLADLNPESLGVKTPTGHTFKYIELSSVSRGSIDMASLERFRFADAPSRARRVVRYGDVLFGTVRPNFALTSGSPVTAMWLRQVSASCVQGQVSQMVASLATTCSPMKQTVRRLVERSVPITLRLQSETSPPSSSLALRWKSSGG